MEADLAVASTQRRPDLPELKARFQRLPALALNGAEIPQNSIYFRF
jgi:hypothetical protein